MWWCQLDKREREREGIVEDEYVMITDYDYDYDTLRACVDYERRKRADYWKEKQREGII